MSDPVVWEIEEGPAYLVRGTDDPGTARAAVVEHLRAEQYTDSEIDGLLDRLTPDTGHWRWRPCSCGGGHRVDMWPADPGRGAFVGVYLA